MFIQPQQGQIMQQSLVEKRRLRRRPFGNEKNRRNSEFEHSRNELKILLAQFGTKTKVAEDLERDVLKLQEDIERLMAKVAKKKKVNKSYEPEVHGTFGVDQTISYGFINSIQDFFADILIENRRFGVSSYEGLVPV
ncbi:24649_t:CDS:2 [Gigaspora margarita]|uniref:24649_t:CDS:1 n=1 Tax=Gigaspora margarita TaxID=4874 RepID=A0ABM8W0F3_GIGMA|nr:24649_t:CDS:2 [Gigaspora margarita]